MYVSYKRKIEIKVLFFRIRIFQFCKNVWNVFDIGSDLLFIYCFLCAMLVYVYHDGATSQHQRQLISI